MSSSVDISNQALLLNGAAPIVSFEDKTIEANALKVLYGPAKQQLLRAYDWNCANKTVTLATLDEVPVDPDWCCAHSLPKDCLRLLEIIELGGHYHRRVEWAVAGKTVLTRVKKVAARYIYDVPEPLLDAHVEMALAAKLALDLSYALTASSGRESNLSALYENKLNEARTTDAQERSHQVTRVDTLMHARL